MGVGACVERVGDKGRIGATVDAVKLEGIGVAVGAV